MKEEYKSRVYTDRPDYADEKRLATTRRFEEALA